MPGAAEEYLLQVAVRRGWLSERARAEISKELAAGAELFDLAPGHMSSEDLVALRRLSQAGGAGQDPRLVRRQEALANSLDDESSQAMFASLAAGGDVVIDLGASSAGPKRAPLPDAIPDPAPSQGEASTSDLLDLLPFARGEMSIDLRAPAAREGKPAPPSDRKPASSPPRPSARPQLSSPLSSPGGASSAARPRPDPGSSPARGRAEPPTAATPAQPRAPGPSASPPQALQAQAKGPQESGTRSLPSQEPQPHVSREDAAQDAPTIHLDPRSAPLPLGADPADGAATVMLGASAGPLLPPRDEQPTIHLGMSSESLPTDFAADGEVTVNLEMGSFSIPPPGDPSWEQGLGSAAYPAPFVGGLGSGVASGFGPPPSSSLVTPAGRPASGSRPRGAGLPEVGETLGPYRIERELARGGMGVVYVAAHAELKRQVALKVLMPGSRDPQALARFHIEAEATARLDHPNVVRIFEVGAEGDCHYFAMDLVEGGSLHGRIRSEGQLPAREAAEITHKLAKALAYCHTHAILHRDLKPANVLMRENGEPVVTDFGLAKDVQKDGLTVTGQIMGTPAYMPPEQADGESDRIDRRTDVYSLGATLFEMLTGRPPFRGDSPLHIMRQVINDPPPRLRSLVKGLDPDLETICLKCLEKSPDQRYLSAGALARDLDAWLRDLPIRAQPPGVGAKLARWGRRNHKLVWLLGGVSAILLAGGLWTLVQVTEARVRGELAREAGLKQGLAQASAALITDAQAAVEEKRRELGAAPLPPVEAPAAERAAGLQRRVASALELSTAAQRWRTIAPESPEAAQACFEADMALGEATLAAEQWVLAAYAFARAGALGVNDRRARRALAGVDEARTAEARGRAAEVERLLSELANSKLEREEVVFGIVNHADAGSARLVAARLQETVARMHEARRSLFLRGATPTEALELEAALNALDRRPLGGELDERHRRVLGEVQRRVGARAAAMAESDARFHDVLAGHIDATLGRQELVVARAACEALGWLGARDAEALAALDAYLAVEADPSRATAAGLALCRIGGDQAKAKVLAARKRFGANSAFARSLSRALGELEGEVALSSETAEGFFQRGEALLATGKAREALGDLDAALKLEPSNTTILYARGNAHDRLGDLDAARRDFNRILELNPAHAPALGGRARIRMGRGDLEGALNDFGQALEADPNQIAHWVGRAQTLQALRRDQDALRDAERAVALGPGEAISWHLRGVTRLHLRDLEGALNDLTRSIQLDQAKEYPRTFAFRAQAYLGLRRPREALVDLEAALELEPQEAQLWLFRAVAHGQLGDPRAALQDLNKALELDPQRADAWANRGAMRLAEGDLQGALADMSKAIELEPRAPQPYLNRAMVRIRLKDHEGALADVAACLERVPNPGPEPFLVRGHVHMSRGDDKAARSDLGRFLLQAPDHPRAPEAKRLLEQLDGR